MVGSLAAFSSPLFSSKSKTWVGLRKSSVIAVEDSGGVDLDVGAFSSWIGILTGLVGFGIDLVD